MTPTGPRSRTERHDLLEIGLRPGDHPGRRCIGTWLPLVAAAAAALLLLAVPAHAFELLSWLRRDLVEVELVPGDWARYAATEITEEGAFTDTLTVTVMPAEQAGRVWLELRGDPDEPVDYLLVTPDSIAVADRALDAVHRALRHHADGTWSEEDLAARREDRLVRRQLEDPFEDPTVTREAIADTSFGGRSIVRERVEMEEVRRDERSVGRSRLVLETKLHSTAIFSADLPLLGLVRSRTLSLVSSRTETEQGETIGRPQPPLYTENSIDCLGFGREDPVRTVDLPH